ncbi:MAG: hypothetical protein R6W84_04375, partial [Promethearchaeia archaeon]
LSTKKPKGIHRHAVFRPRRDIPTWKKGGKWGGTQPNDPGRANPDPLCDKNSNNLHTPEPLPGGWIETTPIA